MVFRRSMLLAALVSLAALAPADLSAQPRAKPTLDYDFYKARVEPIFLRKKAGFTRCVVPERNKARLSDDGGLELVPVGTLTQALEVLG